MKVYLITGGAGFIPSTLIESLLKSENVVYSFDNFDSYYSRARKEKNLEPFRGHKNFHFFEGDLCSTSTYSKLDELGCKPDVVIHLAAMAGVRPSLENPKKYWEVNILGTNLLLQWITRLSNSTPSIVFSSSSSVYGTSNSIMRETDSVDHPISPYAATKKAGELMCHTYSHLYGLKIACTRLFTVYGPKQRPDLAIGKFLSRIIRDQPIEVFGDGESLRDYTYVSDIVDGIIACANFVESQDKGFYRVYNLGHGHPIKLKDMVATLEKIAGKKAIVHQLPSQAGDVSATYASRERAKQDFGFSPKVSFEDGITNTLNWIRSEF